MKCTQGNYFAWPELRMILWPPHFAMDLIGGQSRFSHAAFYDYIGGGGAVVIFPLDASVPFAGVPAASRYRGRGVAEVRSTNI